MAQRTTVRTIQPDRNAPVARPLPALTTTSWYSGPAQFNYPSIFALSEMNTAARYPDPEYKFDEDAKSLTLNFRDRILVVTDYKDRLEARRVAADIMLAGFYAEHKLSDESQPFDKTAQKYMDTPRWKEHLKKHKAEHQRKKEAKIERVRANENLDGKDKERRIKSIVHQFVARKQPLYRDLCQYHLAQQNCLKMEKTKREEEAQERQKAREEREKELEETGASKPKYGSIIQSLFEISKTQQHPMPEFTFDRDDRKMVLKFQDRVVKVPSRKRGRDEAPVNLKGVAADIMLGGFYANHELQSSSEPYVEPCSKLLDKKDYPKKLKGYRESYKKRLATRLADIDKDETMDQHAKAVQKDILYSWKSPKELPEYDDLMERSERGHRRRMRRMYGPPPQKRKMNVYQQIKDEAGRIEDDLFFIKEEHIVLIKDEGGHADE